MFVRGKIVQCCLLKKGHLSQQVMLRTNLSFLAFVQNLYQQQGPADNIELKTYEAGAVLLQQDQKMTKVMIVKEGLVKCFFNEENGRDYIVEFLGKGEIIGEIEAIRNTTCLCNIQALQLVQVYIIPIATFKKWLQKDLAFNALLIDELAERIINTSSRASFQQLHTLEHGLAKLMELQTRQHIHLSKEDMAAYLGITIRSLNRALKSMGE